jgi:hypothetical protein
MNKSHHFEVKLEMFGAEKLCKDIKLEDLSPEDLLSLNNWHMQFLANRDPAGWLIIVVLQHVQVCLRTESAVSGTDELVYRFCNTVFRSHFRVFFTIPDTSNVLFLHVCARGRRDSEEGNRSNPLLVETQKPI